MTSICKYATRAAAAVAGAGSAFIAGASYLVQTGKYQLPQTVYRYVPEVTEKVCKLWFFCEDVIVKPASWQMVPHVDSSLDKAMRFGAAIGDKIAANAVPIAVAAGTIIAVRMIQNRRNIKPAAPVPAAPQQAPALKKTQPAAVPALKPADQRAAAPVDTVFAMTVGDDDDLDARFA